MPATITVMLMRAPQHLQSLWLLIPHDPSRVLRPLVIITYTIPLFFPEDARAIRLTTNSFPI